MTGFLSLFMSLMMAFSMISGALPASEEPAYFELTIATDQDALQEAVVQLGAAGAEQDPSALQETIEAVSGLVNSVSISGVADSKNAELVVRASNEPVVSLSLQKREGETVLASTLLPGIVLTMGDEFAKAQLEQLATVQTTDDQQMDLNTFMEALSKVDTTVLLNDVNAASQKIAAALEGKMNPENVQTGEFEVNGYLFSAMLPLDLTYEETAELLLTFVKDVVSSEGIKPIMELFPDSDIPAGLDKAIEDVKANPPYTLDVAMYTNEAGDSYMTATLKDKGEDESAKNPDVLLGFGTVDGLSRLNVDVSDQTDTLSVAADFAQDGTANGTFTVISEGDSVRLDGTFTVANGSSHLEMNMTASGISLFITEDETTDEEGNKLDQAQVFLAGAEKAFLTFTAASGKGGEFVGSFEGETFSVEEAMKEENAETANQKISMTFMTGLMTSMNKLVQNLPEKAGTLLMSLMGGGTTAPTTTTTEQ